ncbi:MAG TPA: EamA family transporter [Acidobacteriaceae bacterium]|nr:EamA family transporter [Acidobacteriaceae bacterium]
MSQRWKRLLAFGIIYFVWGSTYIFIRWGVEEVPPLLFAAIRFFTAGLLVLLWMAARREPWPGKREWGSICLLAALIFVGDYGLLFWAEQKVASGIAGVMMATIPVFIAIAEILLLRTQRMTMRLAASLVIGLAGVTVLMSHSFHLGSAPISTVGALALIAASIFWSVASVMTRRLPLPSSKVMSAGAQMLAGGVMLAVVAVVLGEPGRFHAGEVSGRAWFALLYLIVMGSLIGFTAYMWLIHRESPTKVGTYAYVNPVVAVLVGYVVGGEPLGARTILGMSLVLASVLLITLSKRTKTTESREVRVSSAG